MIPGEISGLWAYEARRDLPDLGLEKGDRLVSIRRGRQSELKIETTRKRFLSVTEVDVRALSRAKRRKDLVRVDAPRVTPRATPITVLHLEP